MLLSDQIIKALPFPYDAENNSYTNLGFKSKVIFGLFLEIVSQIHI